MKKNITSFLIVVLFTITASAKLDTYNIPLNGNGIGHNDDYTVRVRTIGGEWNDLYEYSCDIDMDRPQQASFVQFDMDEPVEVMVKKNNGYFDKCDIRPSAAGIKYKKVMNAVTFILDKPEYLSVEFDGDKLHNLHIFANPLLKETYNKDDRNVMYFEAGRHKPQDLPNNTIRIPSNTTVYLAPGAVVEAKLLIDHAENVKVVGRGIISHAQRGLEITYSKNVTIDGCVVLNPDHYSIFGGESDGLGVSNFKSFSSKGWSDGIDLMSCSNVKIHNIFMRNRDDCLAFYNHRWDYYGDSRNISVDKAVLWADVAHPINIGGHGNYEGAEVMDNVKFSDIDILEQDEDDRPYQGCMSISVGDNNTVKNVLFDNIRVEDIEEGCLFYVEVRFNGKYDHKTGKGAEDITFSNITYTGYGENKSLINGYSEGQNVKNVKFENIVINGKRQQDFSTFSINKFTKGLSIK